MLVDGSIGAVSVAVQCWCNAVIIPCYCIEFELASVNDLRMLRYVAIHLIVFF